MPEVHETPNLAQKSSFERYQNPGYGIPRALNEASRLADSESRSLHRLFVSSQVCLYAEISSLRLWLGSQKYWLNLPQLPC